MIRRREFITLVGSAVASGPLAARAQQVVPVVGFLNPQSPEGYEEPMRAFRRGLRDTGYVEGENVAIEYRSCKWSIFRCLMCSLAGDGHLCKWRCSVHLRYVY